MNVQTVLGCLIRIRVVVVMVQLSMKLRAQLCRRAAIHQRVVLEITARYNLFIFLG